MCCDGASGPITFVEQCTVGICEGFQGKEIMEDGHCDGGDNDACKNEECSTAGSGKGDKHH